jgi:hypothetical protein
MDADTAKDVRRMAHRGDTPQDEGAERGRRQGTVALAVYSTLQE